MTTETAPDPTIEAWSDRLEAELTEAGMEQPQAKAYRLAFELGLTRVISQTATRQELKDEIRSLRQELKDEIAAVRQELKAEIAQLRGDLRREMDVRFGLMVAMFGGVFAVLGVILSKL